MKPLARIIVATAICAGAAGVHAAEYLIDPVHSASVFRVNHLGFSYTYGLVPNLEGSFTFDAEKPEDAKITVQANVSDLTTQYFQRDAHLKNEDFFDVEKYPAMRFESASWKPLEGNRYEVTGDLTILAVTKPITITVEFVGEGEGMRGEYRAGFDTQFTIKRSDFGMDYMLEGIGDEVTINVGIEGIREE